MRGLTFTPDGTMNSILRYVLTALLSCPLAAFARDSAYEPVLFLEAPPSAEAKAVPAVEAEEDMATEAEETLAAETGADPDTEAPEAEAEEELDAESESLSAPEAPEDDVTSAEPSEEEEEFQEDAGDDELPPPVQDTRTAAERTGAILYDPAMDENQSTPGSDTSRRVRFELGVRCLGVWLTDDRQGEPFHNSFIGSIYKLKAKQNWAPINPYLQVKAAVGGGAWLGVGATYSHLKTETLDNGGGDGDIVTDAVLAYVLLERPFVNGRIRPFVQVGGGMAINDFDAIGSWGAGGMRSFELDDAPAFLVAGGCAFGLTDHFALDAYVRYLRCEMDGTYVYRGDARPDTDFTFPISHVAAGVGVSYVF